MTETWHWGIIVNSEVPVTGVLLSNNADFLYEDALKGIDIDFKEHLKECKNEYHDNCWMNDEPTYLIGFKKDEKGEYILDEKAEYSAIVGQQETQVLRSGYVSRVALCSPCFPGQGDLDTPGEFLAFTLPPEVWGERKHLEIVEWKEVEEDARRK